MKGSSVQVRFSAEWQADIGESLYLLFITEQNERGSEGNETNVEKIVYTDRHDRRNTMEKIVLFTIPMLIGNIAQQLYNTVDSIIVGRYVGDNALAAVGSASPILNLLIVLFIGISVGVSIMVASILGRKKGRIIIYNRRMCDADSDCCNSSDDCFSICRATDVGNAPHTGKHYRLVYFLSDYYDGRDCRHGLL